MPKSKSTFAPFDLYPNTLANNVSPNDHVGYQTSKSKLNGPWGPFSLQWFRKLYNDIADDWEADKKLKKATRKK